MGTVFPRTKAEESMGPEQEKQKGHTDPEARSLRHYYGLKNQGATCYLNSVLQVLFMTPEIRGSLSRQSTSVTDEELGKLFENLTEQACGTENFTQRFGISNVSQQCDAAQCLENILQKMSPEASQIFKGELELTTKCWGGHSINEEENPFWTLALSHTDAYDETFRVERGFDKMFESKSFTGDDMVYCSVCDKNREATSTCEMKKFPRILILLLKRFDFDNRKSSRCVEVPRVLKREEKIFKLYAIVNHMGSLRGGHYTATIQSREDKTWYKFDDSQVRKVKDQPFVNSETYESSDAYLLVYRASENLKPKKKDQDHIELVNEQEGDKEKERRIKREEKSHGKLNTHRVEKEEQKGQKVERRTQTLGHKEQKIRKISQSKKENSGLIREERKPFVSRQNPIEPQTRKNHSNAMYENGCQCPATSMTTRVLIALGTSFCILIPVITLIVIFS